MPGDDIPHDPYMDQHTIGAEEAARLLGMMKKDETGVERFGGRETIGRDTFPIEGKVDIRAWQGDAEAIVVDSKADPEGYDLARHKFRERLAQQTDASEGSVLRAIYETVGETMQYDIDGVDEINQRSGVTDKSKTNKVNLGVFLGMGKGVCRHMALEGSWLGGEAVEKGLLPTGTRVTAEVNEHAERGAHEWARATLADGTVYILDNAQHFFGTLEEAVQKAKWNYLRPEEKDKYLRQEAGGQLTGMWLQDSQGEITISPEQQQKYEWFGWAVSELEAGEQDHKKANKDITEDTLQSMVPATARVLDEGAQLLGDVITKTDFDVAKDMQIVADTLADTLSSRHGVQIERLYPKGMIVTVDEQRQWLLHVCKQLRQVQPGDRSQGEELVHLGMEANRKLKSLLDKKFPQAGNAQ